MGASDSECAQACYATEVNSSKRTQKDIHGVRRRAAPRQSVGPARPRVKTLVLLLYNTSAARNTLWTRNKEGSNQFVQTKSPAGLGWTLIHFGLPAAPARPPAGPALPAAGASAPGKRGRASAEEDVISRRSFPIPDPLTVVRRCGALPSGALFFGGCAWKTRGLIVTCGPSGSPPVERNTFAPSGTLRFDRWS
eukprot:Hpha_TRINITY_DN16202_c2_g1::TRINITY_DN16202_c2_g1_i5::g.11314::m.11314